MKLYQRFNFKFWAFLIWMQLSSILVYSQIQIVPMNYNPYEFKVSDLFQIDIQNSGEAIQVRMVVEVSSGQSLYNSQTANFGLIQGNNHFDFSSFQLTNTKTTSLTQYEILRREQLFPAGDYTLCYRLENIKTNEQFETCIQREVIPITPILLLNPGDQNQINTLNPLLMWLAPTPSTLGSFEYQLKLTELIPGQTCMESIRRNPGVLTQQNIKETQLLYNVDAFPLQNHHHYCWQVVSPNNRKVDSEIWGFEVKLDTMPEEEKVIFNNNYIIPSSDQNQAIVNIKKVLRVFLETPEPINQLQFKITNLNGGIVMEGSSDLIKNEGNNRFVINLEQTGMLKNKGVYFIVLKAPQFKKPQMILFKYYN